MMESFKLECDNVAVRHPAVFDFQEIECETEYPEECMRSLKKIFDKLEIQWEPSKVTKIERALNG